MAKRYVDTKIFQMPFFRKLPMQYKLLWQFILCECDHAGIWIVDEEYANLRIGKEASINVDEALKYFNREKTRIIPFHNGEKWFIVDFIQFQYDMLSPYNRAHSSVITLLEQNGLKCFLEEVTIEGKEDKTYYKIKDDACKPLGSPLEGAKQEQETSIDNIPEPTQNVDVTPIETSKKENNILGEHLINKFNEICVSLPKVVKATPERKKHILNRLKDIGGEEKLIELFMRTEASDFLTGRTGRFTASFDWLIGKKSNWIKVMEGNYDNNRHTSQTFSLNYGSGSKKDIANREAEQILFEQCLQ